MRAVFDLVDAKERDAIRERVDENMCVEAGAGTGKTTVLVDRIVHLLATTDTDVRRIAVITYTEKAAAELAGRERRGLEDALAATTDAVRAQHLDDALRGLNHAHIETIHAFAASLLRERPVEAKLAPGFEVLDVLPAQLVFESAYGEWLTAEMAGDPPPLALIAALDFDLRFDLVRQAAQQLHRNRDMLPLPPAGAPRGYERIDVDPAAALDELAPYMAELAKFADCAIDEEDEAHQELTRMLDWHGDTLRRGDTASAGRAIVVVRAPWFTKGSAGNWRKASDCAAVKAALKAIRKILDDARDGLRQNAVADLLLWLQGFVEQYEVRRREDGKADFDDLLIWARNLIRDDDGIRAYFQSKFQRVFVDEFQDTDPLQAELIISLCAEGPLPADWRRTKLRPGSLFAVGDPKQSIYRFRRADIAMYDEVKRYVFNSEPLRIVQNFRSASPIIDWVNRTFTQLFDPEEGVQPPYVGLAARPDYQIADAVTVLRGAVPPPGGKRAGIEDIRRFEARKLAALIRSSVRAETWRVRAPEGGDRAAQYRDVVVVIPDRRGLDIYEEEFARAELPYRHEGGRTFFVRQEVRELVAVLRAIDDPGDAVAAVAALRSAAFGCSDEDLLLHKHAGGGFDYTNVHTAAPGAAAAALRVLRDLSALRYEVTLPEMLRAVLDRTRLVEFAMLQPQGGQIAANLLKMIDQARTFAEASGHGLRGFVRWLKENIDRASDETDAPVSEETDDVVRIVTIHASKGLEFPIVVFANMAGDRRDYTTVLPDRANGRLHVKLGKKELGFRTPGYDGAEAAEERHSLAEELRLLYVAATRAKDRLVLSFIAAKDDDAAPKGTKCLSDWLRIAGAHLDPAIDLDTLAVPQGELPIWRGAIDVDAPSVDIARVKDQRTAWVAEHDGLVARGGRPLLVQTASALNPEWDAASSFAADGVRRGRAAEFGTAVHALLERTALRGDRIDALAAATAKEFGVPDREREMIAVARRALASDAVRRALASKRLLLEAPFTVGLAQAAGLAEGRIDLLFEEDGGLVIVDFKTDDVSPKEVDARSETYRNQALVYAWSAQTASRVPVREVILLFARLDPAIERTFSVDAAFLAEAESLLAGDLAQS